MGKKRKSKKLTLTPTTDGVNVWTLSAAYQCKNHGLSAEEAIEAIRSTEDQLRPGRVFRRGEIERSVSKAYSNDVLPASTTPRWWGVDGAAQLDVIMDQNLTLDAVREASPVGVDGLTTDIVLGGLFPSKCLLCIGKDTYTFGTRSHKFFRGKLDGSEFIVPSPMSRRHGRRKSDGALSEHTLDNTGDRRFIVVEFDSWANSNDPMPIDFQAPIVAHLSHFAPLALSVFSGSKSLHSWFFVGGWPEAAVAKFFGHAISLGADSKMWGRSQFARLPFGTNSKTGRLQTVHYFNPNIPNLF